MEWSDEHDVLLCREILTTEPFKAKRRTPQRGQLWQSVADHLKSQKELSVSALHCLQKFLKRR